ncbi:hypothetical protein [Rhizobium leguminosarum]|uniref:hypothetical protein n=1 Tax=Rhizobium leguminosarum TaxID=384 RepID=UPI001C97D80D|nr:hypothetical protein [Rhizobium leguminosarum]MBY5624972.1 hypothetical protein [Rhizobium leguminosarum]
MLHASEAVRHCTGSFWVGNVRGMLASSPGESWDDIVIVRYSSFPALRRILEGAAYEVEAAPPQGSSCRLALHRDDRSWSPGLICGRASTLHAALNEHVQPSPVLGSCLKSMPARKSWTELRCDKNNLVGYRRRPKIKPASGSAAVGILSRGEGNEPQQRRQYSSRRIGRTKAIAFMRRIPDERADAQAGLVVAGATNAVDADQVMYWVNHSSICPGSRWK